MTEQIDTTNPKDILGLKKTPLRLVPPALKIFVAWVMALGAKKYGPYNWREKKVRQTVYIEAAMRHLEAVLDGENCDPESGLPHEAHAAACMGIILDARAGGHLIDDRPIRGSAAALMAQFTEQEKRHQKEDMTSAPDCGSSPRAAAAYCCVHHEQQARKLNWEKDLDIPF